MKKASKQHPAKEVLSIRLPPDLKRQMEAATETGPYRISITALVERGIELAIKEIGELRRSK